MNIYIHIPFCDQRCGYCSFFTRAGQNVPTQIRVLENIKRQWNEQKHVTHNRETLYMGGGTPSSLADPVFADFLSFVRENIWNETTREWTIEMHPEHVTVEKLEKIWAAGCTRVSIGIQSFDHRTREALGRTCSDEAIERACTLLSQSGRQWSADLIFGVAGQTLQDWERDLDILAQWRPHGVSLYDLEEYSQGIDRADETIREAMINTRDIWAQKNGYKQYEVSNFAQPGYECQHHLDFWYGKSYYGLGPGAVSCLGNTNGLCILEGINDFETYCTAAEQTTLDHLDTQETKSNLWERFTRLQWEYIEIPEWIQEDRLLMRCLQNHGTVTGTLWHRDDASRYHSLPFCSRVFDL